ncbi:MAG: lysozyme inhibitor LprI family protein [Methylobacterium frigidaeris]
MRRIVLLSLLVLAPGAAFAQAPAPCSDAPNQMAAGACVSDRLDRANADLNRVYGVLKAKLDANGQHNLLEAQRAWLTFRDKECSLRTGADPANPDADGTIGPMLVGECLTGLTLQRTRDLQAQVRCPGGDLSCSP